MRSDSAPELILASTSPYRRALLARLRVPFRWVPPLLDEASALVQEKEPRLIAENLAMGKAVSLAAIGSDAVIIGCDQLVSFEGWTFGKPGSLERAVEQLQLMAGRSHELITALAVVQGERSFCYTDVTRLHMRNLTRAEIERYVDLDRPLDCAGSYKLEEGGIVLFDRIETSDYTAITGLPLIALTTFLRQLGFSIP
jgi:septum formation protein